MVAEIGRNNMTGLQKFTQNVKAQDPNEARQDARLQEDAEKKIVTENEAKKNIPSPNGEGELFDLKV